MQGEKDPDLSSEKAFLIETSAFIAFPSKFLRQYDFTVSTEISMIAAMRLYPTPCRRRSIISLFCSSVIFSPYEKSGHPYTGMAAAVVMRFSDGVALFR